MKQIDTQSKKFRKFKQISAIVGIVILVGMYVASLVAALCKSEHSQEIFITALFASFVIPVIIYLIQLFYKLGNGDRKDEK